MEDITLNQIRYFVAVADHKQFTAAAEELKISQPPLSYQIKKLEKSLGSILLIRGSRTLELTEAGKLFYNRATHILNLIDITKREVEGYVLGQKGTINLGVGSSISGLLPAMIKTKFNDHDLNYEIYEGNTNRLLELLNQNIISMAFVRTPFVTKDYESKLIATEPMVAVGHKKYFEGINLNIPQSIEAIGEKPIIIYRRFETLIKQNFENKGLLPNILCYNDDARTTISWAEQGWGIGIIPKSALKFPLNSACDYFEINDRSLMTSIELVWNKEIELSPTVKHFIESFKKDELI